MAFSQARSASRFHIVNQLPERTFIVLQLLAAVETLQGRENLVAQLFDPVFALTQYPYGFCDQLLPRGILAGRKLLLLNASRAAGSPFSMMGPPCDGVFT